MLNDKAEDAEYKDPTEDAQVPEKDDAANLHGTHSATLFDLPELAETYSTSFGRMVDTLNRLSSVAKSYNSTIRVAFQTAAALNKRIRNIDWPAVFHSFEQLQNLFSEIVRSINIPALSEEQKEEMLAGHRAWGKIGWTSNPITDGKLFDRAEDDLKTANQKALKECSNKNMQKLFQRTKETKRCKTSDFAEAVFDFENKKYKSCALILFGLIDAILIRLQKPYKKTGKKRDVGIRAINNLKQRAKIEDEKHMFFELLAHANLFACLYTVFDDTEDFTKQTSIINRNLLDHGMITRRVTRKDCVQLFLLYYNLLDLLEFIYQ